MHIFLTGHLGYIGAHLTALLKERGDRVTGCDLNLYPEGVWGPLVTPDCSLEQDIRALTPSDLEGSDAICHLAALSNDPMGAIDPPLTFSVNRDGTAHLARLAKQVGIQRFYFAGSCAIYGQTTSSFLNETAPLAPLSAYAQSKVEGEKILLSLADATFSPVILRNATAYGYSPVQRFDLVVNDLLAQALLTRTISILSDGTPWRPLIHCYDIARAFVALLEAPQIKAQSINIGSNEANYQVATLGKKVEQMTQAHLEITGKTGPDPRSYRVCFDRLNHLLPDFTLAYSLESGIQELKKHLENYLERCPSKGYFSRKRDQEGQSSHALSSFVRLEGLKKQLPKLQISTTPTKKKLLEPIIYEGLSMKGCL